MLIAATERAGESLGPAPGKKSFPALPFGPVEAFKISITHPLLKLNRIRCILNPFIFLKDTAFMMLCIVAD